MVPGARLELARCCHRRILSPLRLPIPPSRRTSGTLAHQGRKVKSGSGENRAFPVCSETVARRIPAFRRGSAAVLPTFYWPSADLHPTFCLPSADVLPRLCRPSACRPFANFSQPSAKVSPLFGQGSAGVLPTFIPPSAGVLPWLCRRSSCLLSPSSTFLPLRPRFGGLAATKSLSLPQRGDFGSLAQQKKTDSTDAGGKMDTAGKRMQRELSRHGVR